MPSTARMPPLNSRTSPRTSMPLSERMRAKLARVVEVGNDPPCQVPLVIAMAVTPSTPRASPAVEAWRLLSKLTYQRKGHFLGVASEFELSPPQMFALRHLEPGEPLPMSKLAGLLHCDNSNVTGIVDRLEDRGLVERRPADHDRRVKHLYVTPKGIELRDAMVARLEEPPKELDRLSASEQRLLRDLLRKACEEE